MTDQRIGARLRSREEQVAATLIELADTLVTDYDLFEFLDVLLHRSMAVVGAAAGGVMLGGGVVELEPLASSSEEMLLLELFELQRQQGPCIDSYRTGERVLEDDLTASSRWPLFAPVALEQGFRSVLAIPLRLRGEVIGALNLFAKQSGVIGQADVAVAQAFADMATIGILHERTVRISRELAEQLQGALSSPHPDRAGQGDARGAWTPGDPRCPLHAAPLHPPQQPAPEGGGRGSGQRRTRHRHRAVPPPPVPAGRTPTRLRHARRMAAVTSGTVTSGAEQHRFCSTATSSPVPWTPVPPHRRSAAIACQSASGPVEARKDVECWSSMPRSRAPPGRVSATRWAPVLDGKSDSLYEVVARHDGDPRPFSRLKAICRACVEVLPITGAGIMLMAHNVHQGTAYATDATIRELEDLQNAAAEGPCLDAYNLGRPVLEPDLAGASVRTWPTLAAAAVASGMRAAFGFPLLLDDTSVGALDLYRDSPGPLSAADVRDARLLAAMATREVLAMQAEAPTGSLPADIAGLSGDRAALEQATGMTAVQQGVSVLDAASHLRAHARAQGRSVTSVAAAIVAGTLRIKAPGPD